jgi:hypothetical protein
MAKKTPTNKPRIFISHAWEDKPLVLRLEAELEAAGAEVWVDHVGIRGGDNLPERISDALEWCNTLLLLWSDSASKSRWVKLEWTNALTLEKAIIPCQLSTTKLPAILAHTVYLDFRNFDLGIEQLLHALNLARKSQMKPAPTQPVEQVAQVIHNRLRETAAPAKPKPPQTLLRSQPLENLSEKEVQAILKERDFFDGRWNKKGKGLLHQFEKIDRQGETLVIDHATGLTWQQSGSSRYMTFAEAEQYIRDLNEKRFGGYSDWRLPTLEEAMSLMELKKHGDLYIDPVFDKTQRYIWTADKSFAGAAWRVNFSIGHCSDLALRYTHFVRAVR